jgi:3-keto-5-aminohexanoate cleavage enzyme
VTTPCIISVAITGSLLRKRDRDPAAPVTVNEQMEPTRAAFEAGATLVHLHVRNDDETPTSAPKRFALVPDGIRTHAPSLITQARN